MIGASVDVFGTDDVMMVGRMGGSTGGEGIDGTQGMGIGSIGASIGTDTGTDASTEEGTGTDKGTGTDADIGSDADSGACTDEGTDTDTDTGIASGADADTDAAGTSEGCLLPLRRVANVCAAVSLERSHVLTYPANTSLSTRTRVITFRT